MELLLRDIQTERVRLTKGGKLKKSKPSPPIEKDEIPYNLPESWTWIRLDDLCSKITDGVHQTPNYTDSGVPFLSVTQLKDGQLNFDTARFISKEDHDLFYQRCDPQKGDVLLCKVGGTIGVTAVIEAEIEFSIFVQLALIKPIYIDSYYMKCVLLSNEVQNYIKDNSLGSAMPYISIGKLKNIKCPLPPLAEQRRIVAKVDRLMSLCDALEAKLQEVRGHSEKLVEVAARQVLVA